LYKCPRDSVFEERVLYKCPRDSVFEERVLEGVLYKCPRDSVFEERVLYKCPRDSDVSSSRPWWRPHWRMTKASLTERQ
jgi:hypothetical protein